jgi:hypothetical protein
MNMDYFKCMDEFCGCTFKAKFQKEFLTEIMCPCCGGEVEECSDREKDELDREFK